MIEQNFKLHKSERLHHKTLIDRTFSRGKSIVSPPLRLVWSRWDADELQEAFRLGVPSGIAPVQMMVTVPKKKLRRAVWRVAVRRRIRESYRLLKPSLRDFVEQQTNLRLLSLAFIYQSSEILSSQEIAASMEKMIAKLIKKLQPECPQKPAEQ